MSRRREIVLIRARDLRDGDVFRGMGHDVWFPVRMYDAPRAAVHYTDPRRENGLGQMMWEPTPYDLVEIQRRYRSFRLPGDRAIREVAS